MEEGENTTPQLFVQGDTGEYTEYVAPEAPAFQDTLPEDLRGSEHLTEVENTETLARYYVDLKKDYLAPPESADGYEADLPEDFNVDQDALSNFKKVAFENGLNQKQFSELVNLEVSMQKQALDNVKTAMETRQVESEKALKTEWGDKYESKLDSAKGVMKKVADDGFLKFMEDTRFGDSPEVIRVFAKMADLISEDAFNKTGTGSSEPSRPKTEDGRPMLDFPSMNEGD